MDFAGQNPAICWKDWKHLLDLYSIEGLESWPQCKYMIVNHCDTSLYPKIVQVHPPKHCVILLNLDRATVTAGVHVQTWRHWTLQYRFWSTKYVLHYKYPAHYTYTLQILVLYTIYVATQIVMLSILNWQDEMATSNESARQETLKICAELGRNIF